MRIVVSGLIAQHPELGGMTWHYLQYLLGLQALGHDVVYLEDSGEWPYTWDGGQDGGGWVQQDPRPNVAHLAALMRSIGLEERWAYRCAVDATWYGMGDAQRSAVLRSADLVLNVSGSIEHPDEYRSATLAYIDTDPVFTQIALANGDERRQRIVDAHDVHLTFASDLGQIPGGGHAWIATRQPIALDRWRSGDRPSPGRYTTIMNWASYAPVRWRGETYAQKDVELARFVDLPAALPGIRLEVALPDLRHVEWEAPGERGDVRLPLTPSSLHERSWTTVDARTVAGSADAYRSYILGSSGEWSVAKNGYVRARCGWFSERSACYLAAGRPVVTQDTGFSSWLPTGEGLVGFSEPDEAVDALRDVEAHYGRHVDAARALADEHFDARRVLERLLEAVDGATTR